MIHFLILEFSVTLVVINFYELQFNLFFLVTFCNDRKIITTSNFRLTTRVFRQGGGEVFIHTKSFLTDLIHGRNERITSPTLR